MMAATNGEVGFDNVADAVAAFGEHHLVRMRPGTSL